MNSVKKIKIPAELSKLARVFPADLYIVGGYVRNQLLGIEQGDIDLCSSLAADKLAKIVAGCGFEVKQVNKQLGTAKLLYQEKVYDYATFRTEKYGKNKGHRPCEITFVDNVEEDVKRRDFTINAIYYNINKETLIDYFNGLLDLRKGIVKAIISPDQVMQNDGERILRMLRLAGELNFKIDKNTFASAYRNAGNLGALTMDRALIEMRRLLYCDKRYSEKSKKSSLKYALKHLNRMAAWKYFGLGVEKLNYNMVKKVNQREFGLLIDMVDTINPASVSYFLYKLLKQTSISKKKCDQVVNIISGYYDALNKKSNKQYFFKYFDNFEVIHELLVHKSKMIAQKYQFFYKYIISYHLVIKQKDLKITNRDLKLRFPSLPTKMYPEVLNEVLSDVFDGKYANEREVILEELEKRMTIKK